VESGERGAKQTYREGAAELGRDDHGSEGRVGRRVASAFFFERCEAREKGGAFCCLLALMGTLPSACCVGEAGVFLVVLAVV